MHPMNIDLQFTLPPAGYREVLVEYSPCSLARLDEAVVRVDGGDEAGVLEYRISGRGVPPGPAECTTLLAMLGGDSSGPQGAVQWRNPFLEPVEAEFGLSTSHPDQLSLLVEPRRQVVQPSATVQIPLAFRPLSLDAVSGEVTVTVASPPEGAPGPMHWHLPVRGEAEARQSSSGTGSAFKFKCKARGKMEQVGGVVAHNSSPCRSCSCELFHALDLSLSILSPLLNLLQTVEIVLKGLASVSPDEEFSHEVLIAPESREHLEAPGVLHLTPVTTRLSAPSQPLAFRVAFAPRSAFGAASAELIVHKASGGRWRFDLGLLATEPETDGIITVEAGMDQTAYVPIFLRAEAGSVGPVRFAASFTAETPLLFNVTPDQGQLLPPALAAADPETSAPSAPFGTASLTAPDPSLGATMWLSYTCRDFGRVLKGRLLVQTDDAHYTFDLRGRVKAYVAPRAADFQSTIDHRLAPELAERLSLSRATAGMKDGPNYVASNAKRPPGVGSWTRGQPGV